MDLYVIYARPLDYPDEFVCRRHLASPNLTAVEMRLYARGPSPESVREQLPEHLVNIGRYDGDDPAIAEVWI
jgi:hypothetical protein